MIYNQVNATKVQGWRHSKFRFFLRSRQRSILLIIPFHIKSQRYVKESTRIRQKSK